MSCAITDEKNREKLYDFKGYKIILLPSIVGCCSKKSNSDLS